MTDAGEDDKIVQALEREWTRCVNGGEWSEISKLYTVDALFFGSKERMYCGHSEISEYFAEVPKGYLRDTVFTNRRIVRLKSDVILSAAYVTFHVNNAGRAEERLFRITFVLVRTPDGWKIAQHHASPREF